MAQFMTNTQGVFESMLNDISELQRHIATIEESRELEILETHLTERIATLTENGMESAAV